MLLRKLGSADTHRNKRMNIIGLCSCLLVTLVRPYSANKLYEDGNYVICREDSRYTRYKDQFNRVCTHVLLDDASSDPVLRSIQLSIYHEKLEKYRNVPGLLQLVPLVMKKDSKSIPDKISRFRQRLLSYLHVANFNGVALSFQNYPEEKMTTFVQELSKLLRHYNKDLYLLSDKSRSIYKNINQYVYRMLIENKVSLFGNPQETGFYEWQLNKLYEQVSEYRALGFSVETLMFVLADVYIQPIGQLICEDIYESSMAPLEAGGKLIPNRYPMNLLGLPVTWYMDCLAERLRSRGYKVQYQLKATHTE